MHGTVNIGLWFDFRHPRSSSESIEQCYRDNLELIRTSEDLGFDSVWLTEHHFQADNYAPSPLVIASAIGSVTTRLRIGTNLVLLPLYHPVRLAEDAATLSILTGGRFDLGVGAGYVPKEYEVFGRNLKHRPSLMEEGLSIIRQAWSGEPVTLGGKRYQIDALPVTPAPETPPKLLLGATSAPGITRAVRYADGYLDSGSVGAAIYVEASKAEGKSDSEIAIYSGCWNIVCLDPEAEAEALGPCLLHQMQSYADMGAFDPSMMQTQEQAIENGFYRFLSVDQTIESIKQQLASYPQTRDIHFWGRFPGESIASAQKRMKLIAEEVIPALK